MNKEEIKKDKRKVKTQVISNIKDMPKDDKIALLKAFNSKNKKK